MKGGEANSRSLPAWVRPMLAVSIGIHALFILVPLPGDRKKQAEEVKPEEETVKITQLAPTQPPGAKPSPKAATKTPPRASTPATPPSQTRRVTPPPATAPRRESRVSTQNSPASTVTQPSESNAGTSAGAPSTSDPFSDFPRYPNAKPGSNGLFKIPALEQNSLYTSDPQGDVAKFYEEAASKAGFMISLNTDRGDAKVYEVSKAGITNYLHLIISQSDTVIIMAGQVLNLKDLENQKIEVEAPERIEIQEMQLALLDEQNIDATDSVRDLLVEATSFTKPGVDMSWGAIYNFNEARNLTAAEIYTIFSEALMARGFAIEDAGSYGGGPLYKVTKNNYVIYLNIPPRQDGADEVFWWKINPVE